MSIINLVLNYHPVGGNSYKRASGRDGRRNREIEGLNIVAQKRFPDCALPEKQQNDYRLLPIIIIIVIVIILIEQIH
ncbi:MAG: hypothetical protein J1E33_07405, partial [Alistipes sp.]|nr:hypothetical protein [Alistipes sp.]